MTERRLPVKQLVILCESLFFPLPHPCSIRFTNQMVVLKPMNELTILSYQQYVVSPNQ